MADETADAAGVPRPSRLRRLLRPAKALARRSIVATARLRGALMRLRPHHELAVCAIFRDEAPYLDEWIRFHLGVGVTHFYLYNNFSSDDFHAALAPWIDRGVVTLETWPYPVGQLPAYRHCVRRHAGHARWIAFIDLDEFLFSPLMTDIRPILRARRQAPAILVYGLFFGSSGHQTRPEGPVIAAYRHRAGTSLVSGKTIANPRLIRAMENVHEFRYWRGTSLDTANRSLAEGRATPPFDVLRYNHYWSRSIEDLHVKVARGDASTAAQRELGWHLDFERQMNAVEDLTILRVAAAIGIVGPDAGAAG